ncbi:HAD-IA family hydrolase [Janibacter melonis]|uniref:HAD-IA family hydrolase n=2 Tax=Janibacter melonis TaxID=262209 RepID=A0A5P8FP76_9MICO|nr:HAD-IA family hydrolase [Janibacter melonis]
MPESAMPEHPMSEPHGPAGLVIFDCDGVLVDSERLNVRTWRRMTTDLGLDLSDEDVVHTFVGKAYADNRVRLTELVGRDLDPAWERRFRAEFRASHAELEIIPGARHALEACVAGGLEVCVASGSMRQALEYKLEATGLAGLLPPSARFSSEEVERGKPEPDVFLLAARSMGHDPARCVVVEDSLAGVAAGRAAGMRVVGYESDMTPHAWFAEADAVVTDMAQVPAVAADLLAAG